MRFMLKVKLQEFHECRDLIGMIRRYAKRSDIYLRDIAMMRIHKRLKCVVFMIERKDSPIEVVTEMPKEIGG